MQTLIFEKYEPKKIESNQDIKKPRHVEYDFEVEDEVICDSHCFTP